MPQDKGEVDWYLIKNDPVWINRLGKKLTILEGRIISKEEVLDRIESNSIGSAIVFDLLHNLAKPKRKGNGMPIANNKQRNALLILSIFDRLDKIENFLHKSKIHE